MNPETLKKVRASREITNNATTKIRNFLLRVGVKAWRQNVLPVSDSEGGLRSGGPAGIPDVCGIYGGRGFSYPRAGEARRGLGIFIGVEIKKGKDRLGPLQIGFHTEARKLGGVIIVAAGNTVEEIFNSFLEQWKQITTQI